MTGQLADILILLIATNGAPIIAARVFRSNFARPVDLGLCLHDGRPVFGSSKTWRGLVAAVAVCALLAVFLGYGFYFGAIFGLLAMVGDLFSSFVKRRLGLASSARFFGLDQFPEALVPSLYAVNVLDLPWWWALLLAAAFMLLAVLVSRPLFWLDIRKRPY
jgi:CDP-2,3-bis-(O-geranylgeranyl)-sn-glycerol synthase